MKQVDAVVQKIQANINRVHKNTADPIDTMMPKIDAYNRAINDVVERINELHKSKILSNKFFADVATMSNMYKEIVDKHDDQTNSSLYKYNNGTDLGYLAKTDETDLKNTLVSIYKLFVPFWNIYNEIKTLLENPDLQLSDVYDKIAENGATNVIHAQIFEEILDKLTNIMTDSTTSAHFNAYLLAEYVDNVGIRYEVNNQTHMITFDNSVKSDVTVVLSTKRDSNPIVLSHLEASEKYLEEIFKKPISFVRYAEQFNPSDLSGLTKYGLVGGNTNAISKLYQMINKIEELNKKLNLLKLKIKVHSETEIMYANYVIYLSHIAANKEAITTYTYISYATVAFYLKLVAYLLDKIKASNNQSDVIYFEHYHFFTLTRLHNMLIFLANNMKKDDVIDISRTTGPFVDEFILFNHFKDILNNYYRVYKTKLDAIG